MATTALLSQPPSSSSSSIFRKQSKSYPNRKLWQCSEKFIPKCCNSSIPILGNGFGTLKSKENTQLGSLGKRELILFGLSSSVSMLLPSSDVFAATKEVASDKELKMELLVDEINAYSFMYPLEVPGKKKFVFKWVVSRKPERYSSAAPLSPDARQRIVSERVDIIDNVIISVSIGPPNPQFLKSEKSTWEAKDVADAVLSDKSALRVTSAQRKAESSVLETHSNIIDGEPYWYYEYLVRKSPTSSAPDRNLFRHYISSTAERDGYLYSLNASTLSKKWDFMGPILKKTVASFRLLPPTDDYVPPYKDPWRIW